MKISMFEKLLGYGKCGVAVIRVSGPKSLEVVRSVAAFQPETEVRPRHAYLKSFTDPRTNGMIDRGLVLWFPGNPFRKLYYKLS